MVFPVKSFPVEAKSYSIFTDWFAAEKTRGPVNKELQPEEQEFSWFWAVESAKLGTVKLPLLRAEIHPVGTEPMPSKVIMIGPGVGVAVKGGGTKAEMGG